MTVTETVSVCGKQTTYIEVENRERERERESAYELADVSRLVHLMMENCKLFEEKERFTTNDHSAVKICLKIFASRPTPSSEVQLAYI
jgi:hypothetical protein